MSAKTERVQRRLPPSLHTEVVAADDRPQADRPPYMAAITFFFFVGGAAATIMRLELMTPQGDVLSSPDTYNRLFTIHGVVMIFFFLIPSIPSVLGNFLIPIMIGARDLAFPRLNLLSWYIFMIGGSIAIFILIFGGVDTGWTFYTPFSTMFSNTMVVPAAIGGLHRGLLVDPDRAELHRHGAHDAGAGDDLVPPAPVRLVAVRDQPHHGAGHARAGHHPGAGGGRAALPRRHLRPGPGRRPAPVPAPVLVLLAPGGLHHGPAGDGRGQRDHPLLRPAADLRLPASWPSPAGIAVLSFLVWGHHMFVSGQSMYAGMVFSILSFLVAIPSAIKVFNWTATLYKGSIRFDTPMLYALGFIGLFTIGGLTGLMLASLGDRRPCPRHLLHCRAFPLHHGRRRGDGLPGRHPLLVAQDERPDVLRSCWANSPP